MPDPKPYRSWIPRERGHSPPLGILRASTALGAVARSCADSRRLSRNSLLCKTTSSSLKASRKLVAHRRPSVSQHRDRLRTVTEPRRSRSTPGPAPLDAPPAARCSTSGQQHRRYRLPGMTRYDASSPARRDPAGRCISGGLTVILGNCYPAEDSDYRYCLLAVSVATV